MRAQEAVELAFAMAQENQTTARVRDTDEMGRSRQQLDRGAFRNGVTNANKLHSSTGPATASAVWWKNFDRLGSP